MGDQPGRHTQAQAQAMKHVLYAFTWSYGAEFTLDPALRPPLAAALADYSGDIYARLHSLDPQYTTKSGADDPPWQMGDGFHMAVDYRRLLSVLRAVSTDPEGYAAIHSALTRYAAQDLGSVPADVQGDDFTVPPARSGRALGALDGVAFSTIERLDSEQARKWQGSMVDSLLKTSIEDRTYNQDPSAYITAAWLHGLRTAPPDAQADYLRAQPVDMARIWVEARGIGDSAQQGLLAAVETSATAARSEAKRVLKR
ncbi:hypothetical protein [Streptomyces erythrochromogenes]|uniref:hypothetical protein n=1 Tax=Streptomyces erythrochromogenes TaxID=285574 RepID=UPI00386AE88F|nr:hypothetical protein OG489_31900 [Streptomyces erythrochromogenes]